MDIDGLGTAVVEQLVEQGLIHDFADLYALEVPTLAKLERLAEKSAGNLVRAIDQSRQRGLARLLFGLGIRHVGERVAAILAARYRTMEALSRASAEEISQVADVGPIIAESVYQFFAHEANCQTLERLKAARVRMDMPARDGAPSQQALSGKVFVLTGTLPRLTRDQARDLISAAGGRVTSSVSRKTDYVLAGADAGSKYAEAQRLGIAIIGEAELYQLLHLQPPDAAAG
jgi:DNA ligase (NAD+)